MSDVLAAAAAELSALHARERDDTMRAFGALETLLTDTLRAHAAGNDPETHRLCKALLDAEWELLGDCHSEPLCELLGYQDEEPAA